MEIKANREEMLEILKAHYQELFPQLEIVEIDIEGAYDTTRTVIQLQKPKPKVFVQPSPPPSEPQPSPSSSQLYPNDDGIDIF